MDKAVLIRRILISLAAGILFGAVISEAAFLLLGLTSRPPTQIEIVIPEGTADLVANGEQPPGLPKDLTFVVGDVLVVRNEDRIDHQLGPLWIPAGASGRLELRQPENLAYECSFQPGRYLGLDINEPLTLGTRLFGVLYAGLPLGILIAVYAATLPARRAGA